MARGTVKLLIYLIIAIAVAYAIVHYWAPPFDLGRH